MDHPIVTVIIPVYNVEEYLEKAVDSIISQTLTNWEMYLVDDGSSDASGEICDRMALSDSRIHVLHQENQGAAAARNAAIGLAEGKYLFFMDADDWTVPEMLYEMVCIAEHYYLDAWAGRPINNEGRRLSSIGLSTPSPADMVALVPPEQCAQMVITGFYIETYYTDTDYYIQKQSVAPRVYGDIREFREHAHELFDCNLLYTPWNKLYLTSYIKEQGIVFPNRHWDDFPFNLEVIRNIERVSVTDRAYYHFIRKRTDSESEKYNENLYLEREEENQKLIGLYQNWKVQTMQQLLEEKGISPALLPVTDVSAGSEEGTQLDDDIRENDVVREEAADNGIEGSLLSQVEASDALAFSENAKKPEELSEDVLFAGVDEFLARRYLERIIGCVENVTNEQCTLSKREKRSEIRSMIRSDSVRAALKAAKPRSFYMKMMLVPLRMKSTGLTYLEGSFISGVKSRHVKFFAKLKDNR